MTLDRTRWCELLVGLERVEVLDAVRLLERLVVTVESADLLMGCGACGTRATVKDGDRVELADLPAFGCPVTLVWPKWRWRCGEADCGEGTWTKDRPDIASARSTVTHRTGVWITTQVGPHDSVSWAAKEVGVTWHTVMDAVTLSGERCSSSSPTAAAPLRPSGSTRRRFLTATATEGTRLGSSICDVEGRSAIDVIEGRQAPDLDRWPTDQAEDWKLAVTITACDLT